jgi:DNA-binding NarL/FixJ family response regulator
MLFTPTPDSERLAAMPDPLSDPGSPPRRPSASRDDRGSLRVLGVGGQESGMQTAARKLGRSPGLRWLGCSGGVEEALRQIRNHAPHVVVFGSDEDLEVVGEGIRRIKAALPSGHVLAWGSIAETKRILRALRAGADGYVLREDERLPLAQAIRQVMAGAPVLSGSITRLLLDHVCALAETREPQSSALSPRQTEVVHLLCAGQSNKEIADRMDISVDAVKLHVAAVKKKLGVRSRTQIAGWFGWRED